MLTPRLLEFPTAYGIRPGEALAWEEVRARLEAAATHWLFSVRHDGHPHTVPLDGIWLDDVWWYGGRPGAATIGPVRRRQRFLIKTHPVSLATRVEEPVRPGS